MAARAGERVALWALVATVTALRIVWATASDLAPDEAYYWTWSVDGAGARADHPPGVGWLVSAGCALFGPTELGVRAGAIACGAVVLWLVYAIAREVFGEDGRRWALAATGLVAALPLAAAGAVIHTPDSGLSACWCAALLGLIRAVSPNAAGAPDTGTGDARVRAGLWVAGAATAAGLWLKLTMGLFLPVALAALASTARGRALLRTKDPWIAAALPLSSLVLLATTRPAGGNPFVFQLDRAVTRPGGVAAVAELVAAQFGLLTPLVAAGVVGFLVARPWRRSALWWATVVPLVFFAGLALWTRPEASWPGVAHASAAIGALAWARAALARRRWIVSATRAGVALAAAVTLVAHVQALRPVLPLPDPMDPTERLSGWRTLGAAWATLLDAAPPAARTPDAPPRADGYGLAAALRFYDRPAHRVVLWSPEPSGLFAATGARCGDPAPSIVAGARAGRSPRRIVVSRCPYAATPVPAR